MEKAFLLSQGAFAIPCVLTEPDFGLIRRIVLGVHGLGGSTADAIQQSIAEEMSIFCSATLRFDFPAHGKSPLESNAFTLKNCVDSLIAVVQFARKQYPDIEDLCIFATGFGAYVTLVSLQTLQERPGRIQLVVQTPSVRMDDTLLAMANLSRETFWAMERYTFPITRPLTVTYRLYEELQKSSAFTAHPIPMLILQGEEDAYIRISDIRQFHQMNENSKLVIIPGASHRFMESGAWDMVLDLTRDWFEFEQVLLTDWN